MGFMLCRKCYAMQRILRESSLSLNAAFLYLEVAGNLLLSYIYWFVITRLLGASALGTVSAMAAFATMLYTLVALGIPLGSTRLLGMAYQQKLNERFSAIFLTSFMLLGASSLIGIVAMLLLRGKMSILIGLPDSYLYLGCLIALFTGLNAVLRAFFISTRRTQIVTVSIVLAAFAKFGAGIGLVMLGWEALGAGLGYATLTLTNSLLLLSFLLATPVWSLRFNKPFDARSAKELLKSGFANWLPANTLVMGTQLGILIVFGTWGGAETGYYFIAYSIHNAVAAIHSAIWETMLPTLSGMVNGRRQLTWMGIKLGLILGTPITVGLFLSSRVILNLFGQEFLSANTALNVLLLSVVLQPIWHGIQTLVYAYGRYREVLSLGLATNIPRVILYIVLVSSHGSDGAALAFLAGSVIGLIFSIVVAARIQLLLRPWRILSIVLPPITAGVTAYFLEVHWIWGILAVVIVTIGSYIRLRVLDTEEMVWIVNSLGLKPHLERLWPFRNLYQN